MSETRVLFSDGGLREYLHSRDVALHEEVEQAPEEHLLQADADVWAQALAERYGVRAPELDRAGWSASPPESIQVDVRHEGMRAIHDLSRPALVPGSRVVVHVPFAGERAVFFLTPSQFTYNRPTAVVDDAELLLVFEYPTDRPLDLGAAARTELDHIEQYLGFAAADCDAHNGGLASYAEGQIDNRRERVRGTYAQIEAAGIPVRQSASPQTYITDALVRRPTPVAPASDPATAPLRLEPVLGDERFEHIVGVLRDVARAMERAPGTYEGMGEEDRRQVFMAALHTHYRGKTTAEAFNVTGKTDLLVRIEDRNVFIGEFKFWGGAKSFVDALDQLFSYAAWRDVKLALVIFVRERDLTTVIERAREALHGHPQFDRDVVAGDEHELRARMRFRGDDRRLADLAVLFVHVPPG